MSSLLRKRVGALHTVLHVGDELSLGGYLDSSKDGLPLFSVGVHSCGVVCTGMQKDDGALRSTLVMEKMAYVSWRQLQVLHDVSHPQVL